ncbi:MAG: hypothetical protein CFH00_00430 [Alphaproteobacteria bacterium MarineAlpha1_Bin1]|nr:MAG: hypothetical protein CFH00_00430 [Alphaproteobacteria bacterium MarineAlpha1_Bin1]
MRNGLVLSSALHVGVVLATIYGLPVILDPLEMQEQQIIVELVTVAERTVSQKPVEKTEEPTPPRAPELKPIVESESNSNPDKTPSPPPEPAKLAPPPPPKMARVATHTLTEPPKAEPLPDKAPKPKPVEVVIPKPKAPIKPKGKPKPPKTVAKAELAKTFHTLPRPRSKPERKRPEFNANRIAALLDEDDEKKPQSPRKKADWEKTLKRLSGEPTPSRARPLSAPMSMSEIDAIRHQIQRCWSFPAGARNAEKLVIRIKVFLNTDGSLSKSPEIVGSYYKTGDLFYDSAVESARRAVLKCAPLKHLPVDKYARWREITLTFNPREMLGG